MCSETRFKHPSIASQFLNKEMMGGCIRATKDDVSKFNIRHGSIRSLRIIVQERQSIAFMLQVLVRVFTSGNHKPLF